MGPTIDLVDFKSVSREFLPESLKVPNYMNVVDFYRK